MFSGFPLSLLNLLRAGSFPLLFVLEEEISPGEDRESDMEGEYLRRVAVKGEFAFELIELRGSPSPFFGCLSVMTGVGSG